MEANPITISLQDDSPGYEVSPARVPLATLAAFASQVREFLKGSGRDEDADAAEVAVVDGSFAIEARNLRSQSLMHDLQVLSTTSDLGKIDPKRRAVMLQWQASAYKRTSVKVNIKTHDGLVIAISNQTNFRAEDDQRLVNVERYVRGEVVDLGG